MKIDMLSKYKLVMTDRYSKKDVNNNSKEIAKVQFLNLSGIEILSFLYKEVELFLTRNGNFNFEIEDNVITISDNDTILTIVIEKILEEL